MSSPPPRCRATPARWATCRRTRRAIDALERRMLLAATYNVVDLGTLGTFQFPTVPTAINDAGQVVGQSPDPTGTGHAFLYSGGTMTDLGKQLAAGAYSNADGINGMGQVVGTALLTSGTGTQTAFYYNGSTFVTYLQPGGDYAAFSGINNTDQIVGTSASGGGAGHAFLSSAGQTPTDLSTIAPRLGSNASTAVAINNAGQIVGEYFPSSNNQSFDHGYILQGTNLTDLDGPAFAISQNGMVTGHHGFTLPNGTTIQYSAYLYNGSSTIDLGTLDGQESFGRGVNNSGQVVGQSGGKAVLYSGGTMMDLNTLIPPGSGWVLTNATAINNSGQIVGTGTFNGQGNHAFLLTTSTLTLQITHTTPVPDIARPNDMIRYQITAAATPPTVSTIMLSDPIPVGTTLVAGSISNGGTLSGGTIQWTTSGSASASVTFAVKVNPASSLPPDLGEITDTVTGQATFANGQTADQTATDTIKIDKGALAVTGRTIHGFARLSLPPIERTIATFSDSGSTLGVHDFSATIKWGDGATTGAAIVADPNGGFDVVADHKYPKPITYTTTITVTARGGAKASANGAAIIQPALVVNSVGLAPVADPTQHSGWSGNFLPNGDLELTLASAIDQVNHDGRGKIAFNIDPAQNNGTTTIRPQTGGSLAGGDIFAVTAPVVIDGTTQPGGFVIIDGGGTFTNVGSSSGTPSWNCLALTGGGSTVSGLDIYDFSGWGLALRGRGGNRVSDNIIGTDTAGTEVLGDGVHIRDAEGNDTVVGGGLLIDRSSSNTIGPNDVFAGNMALTRDQEERLQFVGGTDVQINGSSSTHNVLSGNLIGVSSAGTVLDGNTTGINIIDAPRNTIGLPGTSAGTGNSIVGPATGILVSGSHAIGNVIQANAIGFQPQNGAKGGGTGIQTLGGADQTTIGGRSSGALLRGNSIFFCSVGINLQSDHNVVQGNAIDSNAISGIQVFGSHNLIGGTQASMGNEIGSNGQGVQSSGAATGGNGVVVMQDGAGNQIFENRIHDNWLLGIDLGNDGVTPNDNSLFSRSGANDLRNYPMLSGAPVSAGKVTIKGTLDSLPGKTYRIEFFGSPTASPTGFGEGQVFLGSTNVKLGVGGVQTFRATFPLLANSTFITAAATDPDGNTSEFSNSILASSGP